MSRPVTLRDIATHVNLSVAAVWRSLADDPAIPESTKRRVIETSRRLNYRPRPYRKARAAKTIAPRHTAGPQRLAMVLIREPAQVVHASSIMEISEHLAVRTKLELTLVAQDDLAIQCQRVSEAAEGVDGMLLSGLVTPALMRHAVSLGLPVVLIGNLMAQPGETTDIGVQVGFDFFAMGHLATRSLWQAGHRRIGFMSVSAPPNMWYERWLAGYRAALAELSGAADARLVQVTGYQPRNRMHAAAEAFAQLDEPPTALVVPDPMLSAGMPGAFRRVGLDIGKGAIVLGAAPASAERFGVSDWPIILVDPDRLGRTCLRAMRAAITGCGLTTARILLPFDYRNLPGGVGSLVHESDVPAATSVPT